MDATFWLPKPSDLAEEEGFGYFRDTWVIGRLTAGEARVVVDAETELVGIADEVAADEASFEAVATALECADADELPMDLRHGPIRERLAPYLDNYAPLGGLELGVTGLVHAFASIGGCYPAASCRGHRTAMAWSAHPVVLIAADRYRCERLEPLAAEAGCGFAIDPARPELLAVGADSITQMMALSQLILNNRSHFRQPRRRRRAGRSSRRSQLSLFDQL
jgi:hypothetical protein